MLSSFLGIRVNPSQNYFEFLIRFRLPTPTTMPYIDLGCTMKNEEGADPARTPGCVMVQPHLACPGPRGISAFFGRMLGIFLFS